ncbi:uncharacterized protein BJ212DRAFT_1301768 [Suillus subaureus]|uniref:Uncharacterized protein n=1 Tax=Suillus subaureus TaxID=48587 RepID=A0A9P7E676_9AGAM|nr:uncharacterized protein BJ212DRAFT_1301768 [Suillus subaureus]KAG1811724.1 hypothetical protein BJ212DRAFT_1301768 [Suillus subaureus]
MTYLGWMAPKKLMVAFSALWMGIEVQGSFDPTPTVAPTMPRPSTRKDLLNAVDKAALALAKLQYQNELLDDFSDSDSDSDMDSLSDPTIPHLFYFWPVWLFRFFW